MRRKIFFSICLIIAILTVCNFYAKGNTTESYNVIIVEKGETLWSIAQKYCNNSQNQDPRKLVFLIKNINDLQSSLIKPGDELLIPDLQRQHNQ